MKRIIILFLVVCMFILTLPTMKCTIHAVEAKQTVIMEVEGDPYKVAEEIETYYPFIDVVEVYHTVFQGLAVEGKTEHLIKLGSIEQIKTVHKVQTYQTLPVDSMDTYIEKFDSALLEPHDWNPTAYTGKGVKIGVIDTGIDYSHPDLEKNYQGGYDVVDFDEDPMETDREEGMPTSHGTHVAGIIAADGEIKGMAPDAEIYAYRALGPGGAGTSVQVLAAIEKAAEDGMDIINLSLGNNVNVPDYPTSMAVNRASELGIIVVIANGNSGPDTWTVGSPATADQSVSVGASTTPEKKPVLQDTFADKQIELLEMAGAPNWELDKDYQLASLDDSDLHGKIAVAERSGIPFFELAIQAEQQGAEALIIANSEAGLFQASVENNRQSVDIPVAAISGEDGQWLQSKINQGNYFIESEQLDLPLAIAPFSSRGPVTVNWGIKPDISAPGTAIWSTVPEGYQAMNGTSMAAPHITGAFALLKEAYPDWTNQQIIGALKTTAKAFNTDQENLNPTTQGMGLFQIDKAIETKTIIYDPQLEFGRMDRYQQQFTETITIENKAEKEQTYYMEMPKRIDGFVWELPQAFTIPANSRKEIEIKLSINEQRLEEGVHEGWLTLKQDDESYSLPYIIVNQTADQPKTAGFEFFLDPFQEEEYQYKYYLTEDVQKLEIHLYHPETLLYERKLFEAGNLEAGEHEGIMKKQDVGSEGYYLALITVMLEDGTVDQFETMIQIE